MSLYEFADRKARVAERLAAGEAGGDEIDAYNQISGVLSGIASFLWPGKQVADKKRFVEAWARFAAAKPNPTLISVPLLFQWLRDVKQDRAAIKALRQERPKVSGTNVEVLSGALDMDDASLRQLCPGLSLAELRKFSYPVLFYEEVRSQVVHEYELNGSAMPFGIHSGGVGVSYVNVVTQTPGLACERRIHFEVHWLTCVLRSIAVQVAQPGIPRPKRWWLEG